MKKKTLIILLIISAVLLLFPLERFAYYLITQVFPIMSYGQSWIIRAFIIYLIAILIICFTETTIIMVLWSMLKIEILTNKNIISEKIKEGKLRKLKKKRSKILEIQNKLTNDISNLENK